MLVLLSFFLTDGCFSQSPEQKADASAEVMSSPGVFPFHGRVRGKSVNVRSGASVNYEIIARVQEGQDVIVLSEVFGWYQILPPEGSSFWVHQDFIKDNLVAADSVNVRSGPSLGGSLSGQLNRGDVVEVISHEGEWIRILPPIQARAWIHKDYVVYDKPYEQDLEAIDRAKKEKLSTLRKSQLLKQAKDFEESEFFKPVDQINFDEIINKYKVIAAEFLDDQPLQTEIKTKLPQIEDKRIKSGATSAPTVVTQPAVSSSLQPESEKVLSQSTVSKASPVTNSEHKAFEGYVKVEKGFGRGKRYKLIQNRRRICFLREHEFSLATYLHQHVKIHGRQVGWVYPRIPVIEVDKIEPLN